MKETSSDEDMLKIVRLKPDLRIHGYREISNQSVSQKMGLTIDASQKEKIDCITLT